MSQRDEAREGKAEASLSGLRRAILLVGVLATIYMISQFFRNSIGVIGPDLAREFGLDARAWLDRNGIRERLITPLSRFLQSS